MNKLTYIACLAILLGATSATYVKNIAVKAPKQSRCSTCANSQILINQPITGTDCLPYNKLLLTNSFSFGAPVQSVNLLCDDSCQYLLDPLVAVGGYQSALNDGSLAVFKLDINTNNVLPIVIDHPAQTSFVYAVHWCCIEGIPYLAVGGAPDPVTGLTLWIYKYESDIDQLTYIDGFSHGNIIYTLSWLCQGCIDSSSRYLAIGGKQYENNHIRLLKFDANASKVTHISSRSFGATVFSIDWCVQNQQCPWLVAGGKTACECLQKYNMRVYSVSCGGKITPLTSTYYRGGTIRVVKWCCDEQRPCGPFPWIAVGGDPIQECQYFGANIVLYLYNSRTNCLEELAYQCQPEKVFALEWLPSCNCSQLAVGSGCLNGCCCIPNIVIYQVETSGQLALIPKLHTKFDDNITSLTSCKIGEVTYMIAGTESNSFNHHLVDPLCFEGPTKELALFKGKFCVLPETPKAICYRTLRTLLQETPFIDPLTTTIQGADDEPS